MGLIEQMSDILRLLQEAKDDIEAWVDYVEEEELGADTYESKKLVSEISSALHDAGF